MEVQIFLNVVNIVSRGVLERHASSKLQNTYIYIYIYIYAQWAFQMILIDLEKVCIQLFSFQ